ncbi:MAG: hypothetical protein Q8887_02700, partial [Candidatus Phytoplasma australasiaticum]|nr:hypothetical protein [Candidatus Phytoplasma australasiaticum]
FDENSLFNPTVKSTVVSENSTIEKQVEQQVTHDEGDELPHDEDPQHLLSETIQPKSLTSSSF